MKSENVGLIVRAIIVSKIFNLCGHDPPTSQTDRWIDIQTDDMRS